MNTSRERGYEEEIKKRENERKREGQTKNQKIKKSKIPAAKYGANERAPGAPRCRGRRSPPEKERFVCACACDGRENDGAGAESKVVGDGERGRSKGGRRCSRCRCCCSCSIPRRGRRRRAGGLPDALEEGGVERVEARRSFREGREGGGVAVVVVGRVGVMGLELE